jgi:hypothetical protein
LLSDRGLISPREVLRALAGLRWRRRRVLEPKLAGFSYREILELIGVTYANVNRHLVEGGRSCGSFGMPLVEDPQIGCARDRGS